MNGAGRRSRDFGDWSCARTRAQPMRGRRIPPPRSLPIEQGVIRFLRQSCAQVRTPRTGPATDPSTPSFTNRGAASMGRRRQRRCHVLADLTTVGRRPPRRSSRGRAVAISPTGRMCEHLPIPFSNAEFRITAGNVLQSPPMLRFRDGARSAYHRNSYQRRREGTRREPPCVRRTEGAAIVTHSPAAAMCGGFGLRTCSSGDGQRKGGTR